jgi:hypothetical protein
VAVRNLRLDDVLTRHQVFVQRLSTAEANKFAKFLREMDRGIRKRLAGAELTDFRRDRLETLLKGIDDMLGDILGRFAADVTEQAIEIAQQEAAFSARALEVVADVESVLPPPRRSRRPR